MHGLAVELDHTAGFGSSPWAAAMLHPSAATMMQVAPDHHGSYHAAAAHHHAGPPPTALPMDLHMPQAFPYYRYREEALCWTDSILELRKEKSRDAARSRRGKENYEFYELAKMLPLPPAITSQLDKASIIRLTISYLKLRDFSGHGDPPWNRDAPPLTKSLKTNPLRARSPTSVALEQFEHFQGTHILQSLDGFAFALAADGRFLYISETVSIYLGLSQVELTGSSVFDYIHHADHAEVAEQLGLGLSQGQSIASPNSANSEEGVSNTGTANPDVSSVMSLNSTSAFRGLDRSFCVRMKSTLTKRGCHFKSSGYRVVLLLCRLRPQMPYPHNRKSSPPLLGAVSLAIALPPPSVHEIRLESDMFVTRVNFDFRIAHCEPRVSELLDYTAEELTGMNMYTLCHGEDVQRLRKCHLDLINKGQMITHYYKLMNKNGGYTWVQTCATVVCSSKNAEEQNIICVNYVISGKEYEHMVMDCCQLEEHLGHRTIKREDLGGGNDPENGSPDSDTGDGNRGNSSGRNHEHHVSPTKLEDGAAEGGVDNGGRGRVDHVTQLQSTVPSTAPVENNHSQISNNILHPLPPKKLAVEKPPPSSTGTVSGGRRMHKRKLTTPLHREEESSCCSSDDEEASNLCRSSSNNNNNNSNNNNNNSSSSRKRYPVLSPASSCNSSAGITITASPKPVPHEDSDGGGGGGGGGGTSVKDLENAMSKHLPSSSLDKNPSPLIHQTTDFSTDTLLKQQQQRSTIQWIGAHHHHLNQLSHQHPQPYGPASALLKQLYAANRESVIRANVHAASGLPGNPVRNGSSPGIPYYSSEVNHVGPLPTPPGSEGSFSEQFSLSHSNQKSNDAFNSLVSSYSSGGTYSVDYHTAAMTPPSSVSPRDKHQQQIHHNTNGSSFDGSVYNDVLRHQYLNSSSTEIPTQPLPLKPQAYTPMHHSALDAYASASSLDQSQFYHSAGFHIYHPSNKAAAGASVYSDGIKNPSNWYTTPS
ncbi:protein trachealess isoform X2 [Planococcus citri]|uniref:protein trachealess isoform X2 n=1 Tax=Planococcus citri TaxID=170843 RepID=UPI0031F9CA79